MVTGTTQRYYFSFYFNDRPAYKIRSVLNPFAYKSRMIFPFASRDPSYGFNNKVLISGNHHWETSTEHTRH